MANSIMSQTPQDVTGGYTSQVMNAANQGSGAINAFDPTTTTASNLSGQNSLWGNQTGNMNNYVQQYQQAVANNPSVTSLYNAGNQMYNVPGLTSEANTLNNAVLNTPNQVVGAAKGFNFDNNQVGLDTSTILGRLAPAAAAATNNAQTAQTLAGQYVQAGQAQNAQNLLPIQAQAPMQMQIMAQQATGWNDAQDQQMTGLIAKMQSGVQLSTAEMQQLASLANTEQSYYNMLGQSQAGITEAQLNNQYQNIPAGNTLLNTFQPVNQGTYRAA